MIVPFILYPAAAVFVLVNLIRIVRVARMPAHLRWELYPVPHEPAHKVKYGGSYMEESEWWTKPRQTRTRGELAVMLPEIFLLKGVWEHNRRLWLWSFLFHWGLYLIITAAILAIAGALAPLVGLESTIRSTSLGTTFRAVLTALSWLAVISGTIGAVALLLMRLFSPRLRSFSTFSAIFNLAIPALTFITGLVSLTIRSDTPVYFTSLTASLVGVGSGPELNWAMQSHLIAVALFLAYFPFSQMTHMWGKYFTYHTIRWDDAPSVGDGALAEKIGAYLNYPVPWSAEHINAVGGKRWSEVLGETGVKNG